MIINEFDQEKVEAICSVIADTSDGLSGKELKHMLDKCCVKYQSEVMPNKRTWLFNSLADEFNINHSILVFKNMIEITLNPASYTSFDKRKQYKFLKDGINRVLLFEGYQVNDNGKIVKTKIANNLDDIDSRINSRESEFLKKEFHNQVVRYAKNDFCDEHYFEAVFESAKGLSNKIREMTGLNIDGRRLFDKAFSTANPCLVMNKLSTDTEKNEHNGVHMFISSIFLMFRNPQAHELKLEWAVDREKALDALALISYAFKCLEKFQCVKRYN